MDADFFANRELQTCENITLSEELQPHLLLCFYESLTFYLLPENQKPKPKTGFYTPFKT